MAKREEFRVDLTANDQASGTIDAVASKVESVTGAEVEITATDEATEVVEGVAEEVAALDGETAEADLTAEDEATEVVEDVAEAVEGFDGETAEATLEADDQATDTAVAAEGAVADFDGLTASATLDAVDDASDTAADAVTALEEVEDTFTATIEVEGGDTATEEAGGLTTELGKGAAAAAGIVAGLLAVGTSASDQILEVAALSEAIGAPLDQTSRLKEVWDLAGGSIDTLERNVIRANEKIRESPELAAALGIEIGENTSAYDIFVGAVNALNSGQLTANERLALAMEVFGARGILLLDDLQTRVGDIDEAMAGVGENELITQEQVDQAIEFQAQWDAVGDKLSEIQRDILPAVNLALEGLVGIMDGRLLTAVENIADRLTPDWLFGDGNVLDELMGEGPNFETVTPTPEQVELVNDYLATHDELGNEVLPATAESLDDVTVATDEATDAIAEQQEAAQDNAAALDDMASAARGAADAQLALDDQVQDTKDALAEYAAVMADGEATDEDRAKATRAARDEVLALADAHVEAAVRSAEARGSTLSATSQNEIYTNSLLRQARTLDGPLKAAVLAQAARLLGLPESQVTEILTTVDDEELDAIERRLQRLQRNGFTIPVRTADSGVYRSGRRNSDPRAFAHGTSHAPAGTALVGEDGPELVEFDGGERVVNARQTAELLRNGAGGGALVREGDVIINLPAGTTASGVAAAARRHRRRNGAIPLLA